jgi:hypothetical protein
MTKLDPVGVADYPQVAYSIYKASLPAFIVCCGYLLVGHILISPSTHSTTSHALPPIAKDIGLKPRLKPCLLCSLPLWL